MKLEEGGGGWAFAKREGEVETRGRGGTRLSKGVEKGGLVGPRNLLDYRERRDFKCMNLDGKEPKEGKKALQRCKKEAAAVREKLKLRRDL